MSEQFVQMAGEDEALVQSFPKSTAVDDGALVNASLDGDRNAFALLFERHSRKLFRVAKAVTHSREDAEDAVQESFQKAYTRLRQFAGRSAFSTWLTRIVVNEALMILRSRRRSRVMQTEWPDASSDLEFILEIPDPTPNPEASYSRREQDHLLDVAMNELTPEAKTALRLTELDELTTKEAAQIVGVTLAAMKSRVLRGRRQLRDMLEARIEPTLLFEERTA